MRLRNFASALLSMIAVFCLSLGAEAKGKPTPVVWLEAKDMHHIGPEGVGPTPPPYHAADYDKYLDDGTSIVQGIMGVTLTNDRYISCDNDGAYLYPDTPFTEWEIQRWIQRLFFAHLTGYHGLWPGDADGVTSMPIILTPNGHDSVVRESGCNGLGRYAFDNVPVGRYVLVARVTDCCNTLGYTSSGGTSTGYGPSGPVEVYGPSSSSSIRGPEQRWELMDQNVIVVDKPGYIYRVPEVDPKPFATMIVDHF